MSNLERDLAEVKTQTTNIQATLQKATGGWHVIIALAVIFGGVLKWLADHFITTGKTP